MNTMVIYLALGYVLVLFIEYRRAKRGNGSDWRSW